MPMPDAAWGLTEKEKQTLRLIVRGHDAKSIARNLDLSVHTINERLRDARRKMAVSSSREAARLLLAAESNDAAPLPEMLGDRRMGEDAARPANDQTDASNEGVGQALRRPRIIIGVLLMTIALGLAALAALTQVATPPAPAAMASVANSEVVDTARQWLTLVDQGRWDESYKGTGSAFQKLNTEQVWAATSEKVRTPLGAVLSRVVLSQQELPAPPNGYQVVKFRTSYANKADAVETVSLERENGSWRVVAIIIE